MSDVPDRERLIRIARAFAIEAGRDVDQYEVARVESEGSRSFVLFHGLSGLPGDHFSVEIDRAAGRAVDLVPGR